MQSKISLKFPFVTQDKEKPKLKPQIKQSIIDDFEKAYTQNCDQQRQRKKNRNVSPDSQFDPLNLPPKQHLMDDHTILDKPHRIDITQIGENKMPLAGRLTEIG